MPICDLCGMDLLESRFSKGSVICKECFSQLHNLYYVGFSPQKISTVNQAYLNLLLAIRDLAEKDGELDDFMEGWVNDLYIGNILKELYSFYSNDSFEIIDKNCI